MKIKYDFICPCCWRKATITTTYLSPAYIATSDSNTNHKISIDTTKIEYSVRCDSCNELMFECDNLLSDIIIKLNKKGYETEYCCEGHIENTPTGSLSLGEVLSVPYLVMYLDHDALKGITESAIKYGTNHIDAEQIELNEYWAFKPNSDIIKVRISVTPEYDEQSDDDEIMGWREDISKEDFYKYQKEFIEFLTRWSEDLPDKKEKGDA